MSSEEREGLYENVGKRLPVGRVGEAHDIAQAYLFLMKEEFSTGQTVAVKWGPVWFSTLAGGCARREYRDGESQMPPTNQWQARLTCFDVITLGPFERLVHTFSETPRTRPRLHALASAGSDSLTITASASSCFFSRPANGIACSFPYIVFFFSALLVAAALLRLSASLSPQVNFLAVLRPRNNSVSIDVILHRTILS
jgi:hypothetical protein